MKKRILHLKWSLRKAIKLQGCWIALISIPSEISEKPHLQHRMKEQVPSQLNSMYTTWTNIHVKINMSVNFAAQEQPAFFTTHPLTHCHQAMGLQKHLNKP